MLGRPAAWFVHLRQRIGGEVLALCAVIFIADILAGLILSSFSVYAREIGISLAVIGALTTVAGFFQLGASLPIGLLSDTIGRARVLQAGMLAFTLAMLSLALVPSVAQLLVARTLFVLAGIAVFQIGTAHLGDLTTPAQRPTAFGLLTTAMGLGFAVGPFLGGQIADRYGYARAYLVGAFLGAIGLILAIRTLHSRIGGRIAAPRAASTLRAGMQQMFSQPQLLLVTFGNMLVSLTFAGAVTTFFPLYGRELLFTQAVIGSMFAIRAVVSTIGRFPNGALSRRFGSQPVMLGAILINIVAMFGIAMTDSPVLLATLLALEGLAFGGYLVAGQTYLADHTTAEIRGTAVGIYATASGIGGAFAPLLLGTVAEHWGLPAVFLTTGWVLTIGFVICLAGALMLRRSRQMGKETV
ncbi:MAG TPA: MFS transporter [Roseiflexaceae bacterium]|nr:MFS transporter [Roseiflexaceae bacterium]